MHLLFRADASEAIGFGHMARVLALAEAATRNGHTATLVTATPSPAVRDRAAKSGAALIPVESEAWSEKDRAQTVGLAGAEAIVVVDTYRVRNDWVAATGGDRRLSVYIDDRALERFVCDVVVNPNVSGTDIAYEHAPSTTLLCGPEWAIVADSFVRSRHVRSPTLHPNPRVLVTMGGSDPVNATATALEALQGLETTSLDVKVVAGSANPHVQHIRARMTGRHRHSMELLVDVADMAALMTWCDVALTASGVTSTELACIGVPGVTFPIVDNQVPVARALARLGMYTVLEGSPVLPTPEAIRDAVTRLLADEASRVRMVAAQRDVIDGQGKRRLLERLNAEHGRRRGSSASEGERSEA